MDSPPPRRIQCNVNIERHAVLMLAAVGPQCRQADVCSRVERVGVHSAQIDVRSGDQNPEGLAEGSQPPKQWAGTHPTGPVTGFVVDDTGIGSNEKSRPSWAGSKFSEKIALLASA